MFKDKCSVVMFGFDLFAFAFGFIASGDVYVFVFIGVGIEFVIGMDLYGECFCYVVGCVYGGIIFGDVGYGGIVGI